VVPAAPALAPPRFLGVDLAWKATNPSGVVALQGDRFPLRLLEAPATCPDHDRVLEWLARWAGDGATPARVTAIGIDAPLLGLGTPRGRRACDDEVSRAFGRFGAAVHSLGASGASLARFSRSLRARLGAADLEPGCGARDAGVRVREVYPNALQVHLFGLERQPGARIRAYKRRRFGSKPAWVARGLAPFIVETGRALEARGYVAPGPAWSRFVAERPDTAAPGRALKALEDRWDAVLCALAVALEHLAPDAVRAYTGGGPAAWRRGYILAPALGPPRR
jgi:predicted RNase H-like nuclease